MRVETPARLSAWTWMAIRALSVAPWISAHTNSNSRSPSFRTHGSSSTIFPPMVWQTGQILTKTA